MRNTPRMWQHPHTTTYTHTHTPLAPEDLAGGAPLAPRDQEERVELDQAVDAGVEVEVGVAQRKAQQHKRDRVVHQDDAGQRGHRLRLHQNPDKVGDDVCEEGPGDDGGVDRLHHARHCHGADDGQQPEVDDIVHCRVVESSQAGRWAGRWWRVSVVGKRGGGRGSGALVDRGVHPIWRQLGACRPASQSFSGAPMHARFMAARVSGKGAPRGGRAKWEGGAAAGRR